jgi:hypothetical protein
MKKLLIAMLVFIACTKEKTIEPTTTPEVQTKDYDEKGVWYYFSRFGDITLNVTKDTLYEMNVRANKIDTTYFTSHYSWVHKDTILVTLMNSRFNFKAINDSVLVYSNKKWIK